MLASKVAGPVRDPKRPGHIRDGKTFLDRKNLTAALDASLKRLRTDYLDLYQLHWPDRTTATFGKLAYPWTEGEQTVAIEETLSVLQDFVREGKVRHVGVSNETPWGVAQFLKHAENQAAAHRVHPECLQPAQPRVRERPVGILAPRRRACWPIRRWPWACSAASTWTAPGPRGARLTRYERFTRYSNPQAEAATAEYVALARRLGLSPTHLALAFINQQPFVTSNLIGATALAQLKENIDSVEVTLPQEALDGIAQIHARHPNPAP